MSSSQRARGLPLFLLPPPIPNIMDFSKLFSLRFSIDMTEICCTVYVEFACGFLQPVGTRRQPSSFLSWAWDHSWRSLTVTKPRLTYGAEWWAVRKKDEKRLHVAEMTMLWWIRGKPRKYQVRNQVIQEDAKICQMPPFLRQKRLNWYGHIRRREEDNLSREMMDMVVPGKRRRGRPRRRGIGLTTTGTIWRNANWQMTWLKTDRDSTGKRWWRLAHKDGEMVSKGEKMTENCCFNVGTGEYKSRTIPTFSPSNTISPISSIDIILVLTWLFPRLYLGLFVTWLSHFITFRDHLLV